MNIQINCKDNVSENDLRYIYHNLQNIKKEYEEDKNGIFHSKYINGKKKWFKSCKGSMMSRVNIDCIATPKTLYFRIKEGRK